MKALRDASFYIDGIKDGNVSVLSQAITLIESTKNEHQLLSEEILQTIIPLTGKSFRLGITGVPGVGKSSFIESFGLELINQEYRVAVLAVDPSSAKSKGSILGDKTRMEKLAASNKAYIRPSPSGGNLGGVAKATYQSMLLCEAAGYDFIIIETVGTGQSEVTVSSMTDFFLLLMLAGAGDELQGIKRGIMEMADALIITKADGDNKQKAKLAKADYTQALHLFQSQENGWIPKTGICSAMMNEGILEVKTMLDEFERLVKANGSFEMKRKQQQYDLLISVINAQLIQRFYQDSEIINQLQQYKSNQMFEPFSSANTLIKKYYASFGG
jgi:LAO/AO transport system kinase